MRKYIVVLFVMASALPALAQFGGGEDDYDYTTDTLYLKYLNEVEISASSIFSRSTNVKRVTRLVHYVKKVYPYAVIAATKLRAYESAMENMPGKRDKRRFMRRMERELKEEFGVNIENFTYMQGEIFLKLLDRETQYTAYELLKMLRGGFRARMYQNSAAMFGFDLRERYEPEGRDQEIEEIVQMINRGEI